MAAQSNSKYDVFSWIVRMYDSCENIQHLITTRNVEKQFSYKYSDIELQESLDNHWMLTYRRLYYKNKIN
jgi:hypothetical protein